MVVSGLATLRFTVEKARLNTGILTSYMSPAIYSLTVAKVRNKIYFLSTVTEMKTEIIFNENLSTDENFLEENNK